MRVALVHDYLREYGGAERVLEDLHELFPEAPVYTAYYNPDGLGSAKERFQKWDIKTSFIQKIPFANALLSPLRIIAPFAFSSFDFSDFNVVISSSNIYFATSIKTNKNTLHIAYIHTPPKMLYGYTTSYNYKKHWYTKILGEVANHVLRIIDFESKQRPDILVANSKNVQARIKKFYRRDSEVIYPGVDISQFEKLHKNKGEYFLALNRLQRGKGTEIVIEACSKLNLHLKVVGSGKELDKLRAIAGKTIEFVGHIKEDQKAKIYSSAKALIVATESEDFGITPIEAMAAGTPVIAARSGGYLETVIEGKTGEFFEISKDLGESKEYVDKNTVENLVKVLSDFDPKKYKEEDCKKQAEKFSKQNFQKQILELVNKNLISS